MPWAVVGGVIAAGGSIIAANKSSQGSKGAANAAADASIQAAQIQANYGRDIYKAQQAIGAPYREAGYTALAGLMDMAGLSRTYTGTTAYGQGVGASAGNSLIDPTIGRGSDVLVNKPHFNWQMDPGYQFRMSEGQRALESSAAARGGLLSGAAIKAETGYAQNFASQEYGNVYNRLASIAGLAQTGSVNNGIGAATYANMGAANSLQNAGYYRGSGIANAANNWSTGINQAGAALGQVDWSKLFSSGSTTTGGGVSNPPVSTWGGTSGLDTFQLG